MNSQIDRCSRCILPSNFQYISFDETGECSYCKQYKPFKPYPEADLIQIFEKAKKKNRSYDALVPLSGGKDSTYALYLAKKKYDLRVLTYTYDNGFLSDYAIQNIDQAVKILGVDHIFFRPNLELLKKLYKATLLASGELCSVCGIGINQSALKLSQSWHIPLILRGDVPTETNTIYFEKIYDVKRFKAIISDLEFISDHELEQYLIYPDLNPYKQKVLTYAGVFGRSVHPLYYQQNLNEDHIRNILVDQLAWQDGGKHADCIAESFSNFVRENRYGYSRRVAYLSNLVRSGEMLRTDALEVLEAEAPQKRTSKMDSVLRSLSISEIELEQILKVKPLQFQNYGFKRSRILDKGFRILDRLIG